MDIRLAVESDMDGIYNLYKDYTGDNLRQLNVILNKERVTESILNMIKTKGVIIAEECGEIIGGIAGSIIPCGFSNDTIFMAMFFYFKEDYRQYVTFFLRAIEDMFKRTTVSRLIISSLALDDKKLDRFYRMAGFIELETHFCKAV